MFLGGTAGQSALTVQRSGPDDHDDCRTLARTAAPSQLADRPRRSPLRYRHHGAPIVGGGARQSSAESHEGGTSSPDLPGNEEPSPYRRQQDGPWTFRSRTPNIAVALPRSCGLSMTDSINVCPSPVGGGPGPCGLRLDRPRRWFKLDLFGARCHPNRESLHRPGSRYC